MRSILIATDFSPAARNAALYGLELAKAFNSGIILTNAYQQMPIPIAADVIDTPEDLRRSIQEQLDNEALFLRVGTKVPVETVCGEGPATSVILDIAKKGKAEMILLGMKGSGLGMRKFFGSTVTALARRMTIPLMVIPEEAKYVDPLRIALADDIRPDANIHILDPLRLIAQRFHSKLFVVRVVNDQAGEKVEFLDMPANLKKAMRTLDPLYEYPVDKDIVHGLKGFIATREINMLVMIPHKHSLLERWLVKSNTRSMIFEAFIPLLILPDIKHKTLVIPLSEGLSQGKH
jgi:nucleotide-binding universal stress UspA family protein